MCQGKCGVVHNPLPDGGLTRSALPEGSHIVLMGDHQNISYCIDK